MSPKTAFYDDVWVVVEEGVYEPADDTFMLCGNLEISPEERMLEIGTGCGIVAIVAAKAGAHVIATDQSKIAVQNARKNVALHKCKAHVEIRQGYLLEPIRSSEKFSLIAFNPPYLPSTKEDPGFDSVWSGGNKGYEITEQFLAQCTPYLQENGRLLLIQSSLSNTERVQRKLKELFQSVKVKEKQCFFFERLLLFEAQIPR